jgi:hypothetical protein
MLVDGKGSHACVVTQTQRDCSWEQGLGNLRDASRSWVQ